MIKIGDILDRKYLVKRKIGQGGMSTVFLVQDNRLQKNWALKTIDKTVMQDGEIVTQSLLTEVEILKKIEHPNIPRIIDIFEDENQISIVLDLVIGQSLDQIIEKSGPLSQELTIQIGLQICDILNYLHTLPEPIIYRDLKPSNLVLDQNGMVRIVDFGIARELKTEKTEDTNYLGTRGYAAPEQYGGFGQTDKRTDVYCLGVTLYHLITGYNPTNPTFKISPIRKLNPNLSKRLEMMILKATKLNPADRYQDCIEIKYALENDRRHDLYYHKRYRVLILKLLTTSIIFLCSTSLVYLNNYHFYSMLKNDYFLIKKDLQIAKMKKDFQDFTKKVNHYLVNNGF